MKSRSVIRTLFCPHNVTKIKLVSWAIDCKGKHEQGFKHTKCCALCGEVIRE